MKGFPLTYAIPLLLLTSNGFGQEKSPGISLDRVFARPEGELPRAFAFSDDGTHLAYLLEREGGLSDLWLLDLETGARRRIVEASGRQDLTDAEKGARERRRERGSGITEFAWQPRGHAILVPISGELHLWQGGALERLTHSRGHERNPRWSPDGKRIAYLREDNVYSLDLRTRREVALTEWGGRAGQRCGAAEFIAMEELGRHDGFWWAPDSRRIAFVLIDERPVPSFQLPDLLHERNQPAPQSYPRAGESNVRWWLYRLDLSSRKADKLEVRDEYLVRVDWSPKGELYVQTSNRAQTVLKLWKDGEVVLEEKDDAWVPFHDDLRLLPDGRVLWPSERTGRRHLYLDGEAVTSGDWDVASVAGLDEERVYFLASIARPYERRLHSVRLDGTDLRTLTPEAGFHTVTMSPDAQWVVDTFSRATQPPRVVLRDRTGKIVRELDRGRDVPGLVAPTFLEIPAGPYSLHAMVLRAERETPGPALVYTYAGPGSHIVWDRWGGATGLWHQRFVQRGYTVMMVDGRGAGGYGRDFMRVVDRRLCHWEVLDQASSAHWLGRQGYVDPARIGIWGWSYGGTMAIACLQEAGDVFAAGAAVAPVTDWRDYDTAYTERYLGLPQENPTNYRLSSPLFGVEKLERPLLLAHGVRDDNVHFRNAVAYIDAAQKAGKLIEMDFYPRGKHGIGGSAERKLLFRRMERFFDRELGDPK